MADLLLVEPDGLVSPGPARLLPGGPTRVIAVVIGVLAIGVLILAGRPDRGIGDLSDRDLLQAHLDAWHGGDFDTAHSLRAPERVRTGPSEERARGEVEYQSILGARAELLECEPLPPSTIRCGVAYSNALNEAVGEGPAVVAQQFGVSDGLVLFVAGPYLEDESLTASFRRFANLLFAADYQTACVDEPNYQPPSCAEFKLAHLEDWASWHRIEEG